MCCPSHRAEHRDGVTTYKRREDKGFPEQLLSVHKFARGSVGPFAVRAVAAFLQWHLITGAHVAHSI